MLLPLINWLYLRQRIRAGTLVRTEFPWFGRHVDLVTLTESRLATAYELKLGALGRALEQASLNRLAFDRSYVVTASKPRPENLDLAAATGIGIIMVRKHKVEQVLQSPRIGRDPLVRKRLLEAIRKI